MVEVFKTNVDDKAVAHQLINEIHRLFKNYQANFDLEDCDRILRIKSDDSIENTLLIELVNACGYCAEVLEDELAKSIFLSSIHPTESSV